MLDDVVVDDGLNVAAVTGGGEELTCCKSESNPLWIDAEVDDDADDVDGDSCVDAAYVV